MYFRISCHLPPGRFTLHSQSRIKRPSPSLADPINCNCCFKSILLSFIFSRVDQQRSPYFRPVIPPPSPHLHKKRPHFPLTSSTRFEHFIACHEPAKWPNPQKTLQSRTTPIQVRRRRTTSQAKRKLRKTRSFLFSRHLLW